MKPAIRSTAFAQWACIVFKFGSTNGGTTLEPRPGIEPGTYSLPWSCSTPELPRHFLPITAKAYHKFYECLYDFTRKFVMNESPAIAERSEAIRNPGKRIKKPLKLLVPFYFYLLRMAYIHYRSRT